MRFARIDADPWTDLQHADVRERQADDSQVDGVGHVERGDEQVRLVVADLLAGVVALDLVDLGRDRLGDGVGGLRLLVLAQFEGSLGLREVGLDACESLARGLVSRVVGENLQQLQLLVATVPQRGDFGLLGGATHGEVVLT